MNLSKYSDLFKRILSSLATVLFLWVALMLLLVGFLTAIEYKPEASVQLETSGSTTTKIRLNEEIDLVSWNIGYGALSDNADYYRDGGKGIRTSTNERLNENLNTMNTWIREQDPDLLLLQDVDASSDRSYRVDERVIFDSLADHVSSFALDYVCLYVPYPFPPLGTVQSGSMTISKFAVDSATRVALPNTYKWPVRVITDKRCLLVDRLPIEGSDKELVVVNLHLEKYDEGDMKAAQTEALRALMEEEAAKGNYVIAGGDFSQIFSNMGDLYPVKEEMWKPGVLDVTSFSSGFSFHMDPEVPSTRSLDQNYVEADKDDFQYYLTDGFIVSSNVEGTKLENADLGFVSSNHNPVMMTVVLK